MSSESTMRRSRIVLRSYCLIVTFALTTMGWAQPHRAARKSIRIPIQRRPSGMSDLHGQYLCLRPITNSLDPWCFV